MATNTSILDRLSLRGVDAETINQLAERQTPFVVRLLDADLGEVAYLVGDSPDDDLFVDEVELPERRLHRNPVDKKALTIQALQMNVRKHGPAVVPGTPAISKGATTTNVVDMAKFRAMRITKHVPTNPVVA